MTQSNLKPAYSIEDVRKFWDSQPLFTGEASSEIGTKSFFDEHNRIYHEDCFAGKMDEKIFCAPVSAPVLDLGCGIGFWLEAFWKRGYKNLTGADLSSQSLEIAATRMKLRGAQIQLLQENAESLSFADETFGHVNCQGVVHHTPSPEKAVSEIHRVLKKGGTAVISVYYSNFLLRNIELFSPALKIYTYLMPKLKGRGREKMFTELTADEIVRQYDGADNPIGISYTRQEFEDLLSPLFKVRKVYMHYFPKRAIAPFLPKGIHRFLDQAVPFMIFAEVEKL